jgi:hypothetical protein
MCMHTCIHACIQVYMHVVDLSGCMPLFATFRGSMCVCVCMYMHAHTDISLHAHTDISLHPHIHTYIQTHIHICAGFPTCLGALLSYTHTCIQTHIHIYMQDFQLAWGPYPHTHIHVYKHTHIHIYMQDFQLAWGPYPHPTDGHGRISHKRRWVISWCPVYKPGIPVCKPGRLIS